MDAAADDDEKDADGDASWTICADTVGMAALILVCELRLRKAGGGGGGGGGAGGAIAGGADAVTAAVVVSSCTPIYSASGSWYRYCGGTSAVHVGPAFRTLSGRGCSLMTSKL